MEARRTRAGQRRGKRLHGDVGATAVEYALLLGLFALVLIGALTFLQDRSTEKLSGVDVADDDNALVLLDDEWGFQ